MNFISFLIAGIVLHVWMENIITHDYGIAGSEVILRAVEAMIVIAVLTICAFGLLTGKLRL